MTPRLPPPDPRRGFSLIIVAVLLAVGGIVVAGTLPGGRGGADADRRLLTLQRMQAVEEATRAFMSQNGRRPCPVDGLQVRGTAYFGVEAANPGVCTGGTPAAPINDAVSGTVAGTVPVKTLRLPDDLAFDGWGRLLTYVADRRLTMQLASQVCGGLQFGPARGHVQIKRSAADAYPVDTTGWALVSHGRTGHGAYLPGGAGQLNAASTDPDTRADAFVDASFHRSFACVLVRKPSTPTFDSIVWYQPATKTTCVLGALAVPPGCTAPWGQAVVHGQSVTAWQAAAVPAPAACASETRLCTSGTLAGSYAFPACTVLAQCTGVPGGGTMTSGQSRTFFSATTRSPCSSLSQTRTCTDGTLNGSAAYQFTSCANYCSLPWAGTLADGQSVTAYQAASVPYGSACASETRTCTTAVLSGGYTSQTCAVTPPANCPLPAGLGGGSLAHGNSVPACQAAGVPYGSSCSCETRGCTNGALSGSYSASQTCSVAAFTPAALSGLQLWLDAADATGVTLTYSSNGVSGTVSGTAGSSTLTTTADNTGAIPVGTKIRLSGSDGTTASASDSSNANTYTVTAITSTSITVTPALTTTYAAGTAFYRGLVSRLADKSGTVNLATQAAAASMPLWVSGAQNGQATLYFDGGNRYLTGTAAAAYRTVFAGGLSLNASPGPYPGIWGSATADLSVRRLTSGSQYSHNGAADFAPGANYFINGTATSVVGQTTWHQLSATAAGTQTFTYEVGCAGGSYCGSRNWSGYAGELFAYGTPLATADRKTVEQYLGTKWGISVAP